MLLSSVVAMAAARAQETGGGISGTVIDAQQASLPGVLVTLRNEGTNATLTATTNDEGSFNFPFVSIGRYTLTAALQGFSTAKQENIEVRVADRLRIDLGLQVGALTEEVTVSAGAPLLETSTALARVRDRTRAGRGPAAARPQSVLARGAVAGRAVHAGAGQPLQPSVRQRRHGQLRDQRRPRLHQRVPARRRAELRHRDDHPNNLSFVPSPDATAEFRVQTSIYDAQYGRTGGGVVNVVLKSGTNAFHGAVYRYYRDESLNANTFDANRGGLAKAGLYWRQPGATLNGPVKIPGLYDGKDKTFFMYSWEQIRIGSAVPAGLHGADRARAQGRLLADADRRRPSSDDLRSDDDAPGQRAVRARSVPGQPDPGEPHRSGRAQHPARRCRCRTPPVWSTTCSCRRTRAPTNTTSTC